MKKLILTAYLALAALAGAQKVSDLTALTGAEAAAGDLLMVVDTSTSSSKKMTLAEFFLSSAGDVKPDVADLPWIDLRAYDPAGDGVTDDSAAFQDALDAAAAAGKMLYVPATTDPADGYLVSDLTIPRGTHIFGDGPNHGSDWTGPAAANCTVIKAGAGATHVFKTNNATAPNEGFILRNLDIRGGNGSSTLTTYGVWATFAGPVTYAGEIIDFQHVTLRGFQYGYKGEGMVHTRFDKCSLVQCTFGAHFSGATHTFEVTGTNLGGEPVNGSNGVGIFVDGSSTKGTIKDCEIGNCSHGLELGGTITVQGCNFETFDRSYAVLIRDVGVVTFIGNSYAQLSFGQVDGTVVGAQGVFVRNANTFTNILSRTTFIGNYCRDGTAYFEGVQLTYESALLGDRATFIGQTGVGRVLTSSWTVLAEKYTHRDELRMSRAATVQRIDLAAAPVAGTGYTAANSGAASVNSSGLDLVSWTTANSSVVVALAKGNLYNPPMRRPGDASHFTVDWGRRIDVRFKIGYGEQGSGITSDDKFALRFGDDYASTATGGLTGKGIGIRIDGTAVVLIAHDGTTAVETALGTLADASTAEISISSDGTGNVKASMTGGAEVVRTGGPTTEGTSHWTGITAAAWNTATSTAIPHRMISDLEIAFY